MRPLPVIARGSVSAMRILAAEEMIGFISFLALLLVFFSIDIRSRDTDRDLWHELLFEYTSRVGGIAASVGLASGWIFVFTQSPAAFVHLVLVAIPGSVAVLAAIILGVEILFVPDVPSPGERGKPGTRNMWRVHPKDDNNPDK